jgi:hypothetical protein
VLSSFLLRFGHSVVGGAPTFIALGILFALLFPLFAVLQSHCGVIVSSLTPTRRKRNSDRNKAECSRLLPPEKKKARRPPHAATRKPLKTTAETNS